MLALAAVAAAASPASAAAGGAAGKVLLDAGKYPAARCLDGTMGAFYWSPGASARKFYLHQQGGGGCETWDECVDRSKGRLGSTKAEFWKNTYDLSSYEVFSRDPQESPLMHDWNMVFMVYCDGGYFSGSNSTQADGLHFRGADILDAVLDELASSYGLSDATDVVLGGCSAGGIATFMHIDYVASHPSIASSTRVSGFPQSGYWPNRGVMDGWMDFQYNVQNISRTMNRECQMSHAHAPKTCIYGDTNAPFIRTPLFLWQSAVDADQLGGDGFQPPCKKSGCAVPFAESMTASLTANVFSQTRNGGFVDYCWHHCGDHHTMVSDDGVTRGQALARWYNGGTGIYNQTSTFAASGFPCKHCCKNKLPA